MACCGSSLRRWTEDDPLVLGEPVGDVVAVIPTINVARTRRGERTWVRGSSVQAMIDAGWFQLA